MRGSDERSGSLFSYVDLEARVRGDHPLRTIREIANAALSDLSRAFSALYPDFGRPSIAPEKLLRAMLLQAFYGIRSERQLMERLEFDLLFRWFVGLGVDDPVWDHSTFSKNRDRLLEGEIARKFLTGVLAQPKVKRLLSSDHFSVDGTLIEAWASIKSFRRKDGDDNDNQGPGRNAERNFHKEKHSNETHRSTTDPDARLYKKGAGRAMALISAVRKGQLLPARFEIRSPLKILEVLRDRGYLGSNTEAREQYANLVVLRVGYLKRAGVGWQLHLHKTPENESALDLAIKLLRTGTLAGMEVNQEARIALTRGEEYIQSLISAAELKKRTKQINDEQATHEFEQLLLKVE
jgi:transposase